MGRKQVFPLLAMVVFQICLISGCSSQMSFSPVDLSHLLSSSSSSRPISGPVVCNPLSGSGSSTGTTNQNGAAGQLYYLPNSLIDNSEQIQQDGLNIPFNTLDFIFTYGQKTSTSTSGSTN